MRAGCERLAVGLFEADAGAGREHRRVLGEDLPDHGGVRQVGGLGGLRCRQQGQEAKREAGALHANLPNSAMGVSQ